MMREIGSRAAAASLATTIHADNDDDKFPYELLLVLSIFLI
jgi:hypothetical protein